MKFKLPLWFVLTILNILSSIIFYLITQDITKFLTLSAILALIFLSLVLIPGNIGRIPLNDSLRKINIFLISKRRDFGITFGFTILSHAIFAEAKYFNFNLTRILIPQLIPGAIALTLVIFMLLTSNLTIQKNIRNWKILHSVIWFTLPVILVHGIFASITYKGEIGIANVLVVILFFFSFLKYIIGGNNSRKVRDILLIIFGTLVGIIFTFINVSRNNNNFESNLSSLTSSSVGTINSQISIFSSSSVISNTRSSTTSILNQVKDHNSISSCWVSYKGKVYDITPFIGIHPGGVSAILKVCGKDMAAFSVRHEMKAGIPFTDPEITQILNGLEKIPSL